MTGPRSEQSPGPTYANLAQCVQQAREARSWTRTELAEKSALPLALIAELEEGRQVFLAIAHRLRLARALRLAPHVIQALEKPHLAADEDALSPEDAAYLAQHTRKCPHCQAPIRMKTFRRADMHGHGVTAIQLTCSQCLFRHKSEVQDNLWEDDTMITMDLD